VFECSTGNYRLTAFMNLDGLPTGRHMSQIAILVVGLAFSSTGCSSLRPPAADRAAWEAQQQQEQAKNELTLENSPAGQAVYVAYGLSMLGYFFYEITR